MEKGVRDMCLCWHCNHRKQHDENNNGLCADCYCFLSEAEKQREIITMEEIEAGIK